MPHEAQIYSLSVEGALHQGEVLSGIDQYIPVSSNGEVNVGFVKTTHPFCVVLSQECDLSWDFLARASKEASSTKYLNNVLLCAAYEEKDIRASKGLTSSIWKRVKQNKDERYQYLEACPVLIDASDAGVPPLVLDFKGYFAIPTENIYEQVKNTVRRCRLTTPYAEHLSSRFAYFLSRLALPRDHGMPLR